MDQVVDFLSQYKTISNKLKKRFLRKPNVAEASEQFGALSKRLEHQECPQYAGFCSLATARCEHTLSNPPGEAHALTLAARFYLEAEAQNRDLKCISFEEYLTAAINCYSHAIRVHVEQKQPTLAAALCLELGNALRAMGKPGEAIAHYLQAAELQTQCPLDCLNSLGLVASCKIETGDYDGALNVLTEIAYSAEEKGCCGGTSGKPLGAYCDILINCEINRILLLMLLQPTPQRIRPEHAQTLEKYTWEPSDNSTPVSFLSDGLFVLLQSVMMACQSNDLESLKALQIDMWPHLTAEQNDLLHQLVNQTSRLRH